MAFGISKAIVFLAPLILSNTLTKLDYGALEYAMNVAFIGAAILSLGVPNGYPYFKLKRNFKTIYKGFTVHYLYLLISSLILILLVLIFKKSIENILSVLFIYTLSNQMTYSIIDKTNEKIITAVIIDSLFYITLLLGYIFILATGKNSIELVLYASLLYTVVFIIITLKKAKTILKSDGKKHLKLIKYGRGIMISGLYILLIANSGRILIDYIFHDKELIAIFSFYFRMASFVVVIHQVLNIIYFKRMYTFKINKLDTFFAVFFGLIVIGTLLTYSIIPLVGPHFFKLFSTYPAYKNVYLILCCQMVFWILLANNENVIYREKLASKMNIGLSILLILFMLLVAGVKNFINFEELVQLLYLLIVLAVFVQFYVLYRYKKIKLTKTIIASIIVFGLSIIAIRC